MTRSSAVAVQNEDHWLQLRRQNIGGTEAAALFGVSPYMTKFELWHMKAGTIPEPDFDDNERVQAGQFLEPAIAAWAADKWGMKIRKVHRYIRHPGIAGMACTLDYEAFGTNEGFIPVEIKNVDSWIFKNEWECQGDEIINAPLHIMLQNQHQIGCVGAPYGWIIANVGGNSLKRMKLAARPAMIGMIEQEIPLFWQSVKDGVPPKPNFQEDAETLARMHLYSRESEAPVDFTGNNRLVEVCHEYLTASAKESGGKKERLAAKAEILSIIGDARIATCGDLTIKAATTAESPGQVITAEMIGEVVGKRAASRSISIKANAA